MYLILITLLGLILRLVLSNQSFWLDEGASLMMAKLPLSQLIEALKADFHPPLFYMLLHFWLPLLGKSEWLIRLPFILLASATIPATYLLCREIFGAKSKISLFSALFLALNPLHIYYSQELRMYSLVTLLVVLSWYSLLKKDYFWTSIFNFLSFFTFYGAIFNIVSQKIYLLFSNSKSKIRLICFITAPTLIAFLLWWPIFSVQLQNGNYLKDALPGWQVLSGTLSLKSLFLIPLKFILGRISFDPQKLYYLVGSILVFLFLVISGSSLKNKKTLPFWIALITPLLLGLVLSLKTPVLGYWRFLFILPFFTVLLAVGIESLPKVIIWGAVAWVCGTFLFFNLFFWTNSKFQREDWRGFSNFISNQNALVILPFPYIFAPLNFYEPNVAYLTAQSSLGKNQPNLDSLVKQSMLRKDKLYVMDYLADLTDPDRKILENVHKSGLKEIAGYNFNSLGRVYEFHPL